MYKGAIIYRFADMENAVNALKGYAEEYRSAGNSLITAINSATADWEGDSKVRFSQLINDGQNSVQEYVCKRIPDYVTGLADMLARNAEAMRQADAEVAAKLPASI